MIKKLLCIVLTLIMLLSVVACNNTPGTPDDSSNETEKEAESGKVAEEKYDGVFKVGYSRVDITPQMLPISRKNGQSTIKSVSDPIYATCIAFYDGETTALVFTVDLCNVSEDHCNAIRIRIKSATRVPEKNVIIHATHNHSSPTLGNPNNEAAVQKWTSATQLNMVKAAEEAIADLTDATILAGTGKTTGMAFVRRYLLEDGTYSGVNSPAASSAKAVKHVSEADDTVGVIRFVREGKKDVVAVNWQCHLASAVEMMPAALTADRNFYIRGDIEKADDDALVAYFAGASGNIGGSNTPIPSLKKYRSYQDSSQALAKVILDVLNSGKMESLEAGPIKIDNKTYKAEMWKDSEERVAQANEVLALTNGSKEQTALLKKYGWQSTYGPKAVVSRNKSSATTISVPMAGLSFGDLAFIAAPYEMFDNNGVQIKEGSPFKTTFILTNAGGALAYVASIEAYTTYGGYEVENTEFAPGEGEKMVAEYIDMLKRLKTK
ncbi:MAG: hypothetical protein IKB02_10120 [Clostridia bacterium]|nr:hypothetical protein [Clostridia bacterium]MBR2389088.1 hypothetical protein [Clostridia bacterium]